MGVPFARFVHVYPSPILLGVTKQMKSHDQETAMGVWKKTDDFPSEAGGRVRTDRGT